MELADKAFSEMAVKLEAALRTAESFRQKSIQLEDRLALAEKVVEAARGMRDALRRQDADPMFDKMCGGVSIAQFTLGVSLNSYDSIHNENKGGAGEEA